MLIKIVTDWVFVDAFRMGFGLELFEAILSAVEVNIAKDVCILIAFEPAIGPVEGISRGVDGEGLGEVEGLGLGEVLVGEGDIAHDSCK